MDTNKLLLVIVEGGSFVAAFAGIAAGFIMANVTKKFGSGILAAGFKNISIGVILIALGIVVDTIQAYIQLNSLPLPILLLFIKEVLFVVGTYIIVIGSKKTGDKLESLTQQ